MRFYVYAVAAVPQKLSSQNPAKAAVVAAQGKADAQVTARQTLKMSFDAAQEHVWHVQELGAFEADVEI